MSLLETGHAFAGFNSPDTVRPPFGSSVGENDVARIVSVPGETVMPNSVGLKTLECYGRISLLTQNFERFLYDGCFVAANHPFTVLPT
jgi:hypothetical protein